MPEQSPPLQEKQCRRQKEDPHGRQPALLSGGKKLRKPKAGEDRIFFTARGESVLPLHGKKSRQALPASRPATVLLPGEKSLPGVR